MSTALATQVPTAGTPVDQLFDFAASHARATNRLKKALDGNGASASDFETLGRTQHMQGIWIVAKATIRWTASWETFAGKARGNIQYADPADLAAVARRGFDAFAAKPAHVETLVALFTASPAKGFAAGPKIELGGAPVAYASEEYCNACNGRGKVGCTACHWGKQTCTGCHGQGRVWTGSSYMRCPLNCSSGKMNCLTCGGWQIVGCAPCGQKGIFTTLWTGSIHADVAYEIHAPAGQREDWTRSLTKSGHAWLAEEGFVAPPHVSRHAGGVGIGWDVKVPVLGQKFRIKDRQYDAQYVGRRERMWRMPRFLDDLLHPLSGAIGRAQAAEAFALSKNAPVLNAVRNVVLHHKRSDEAVAGDFENAVTTKFVAQIRLHLEVARDRIARSTIKSVWNYAAVSLTVGALAALASGQFRLLLAEFNPAQQHGDSAVGAALVGGLVLAALLGATYLLAGLAGRSAVRTVLETKAERLPSQGRTPAIAAAASLAIYGACAYLIVPGMSDRGVSKPSPAVASIPHVRPPTVPFVPSR